MNGIRNSFESRDVSYGSVATSSIGPCRLFHALSAVSSRMAHKVARDNALNLRLFISVSTSFEFFSSFPRKDRQKNNYNYNNISIVNHLLRLRKKDREDRSNSLLNREEEENESLRSFNYIRKFYTSISFGF